jgi:hypothetical protein
MYHTSDRNEGELEPNTKAKFPRETTTHGEQDSESLDSEDLYVNVPGTSKTTDGRLSRCELKPSLSPDYKEQSHRSFRKCGVISLISLLFIGLGVLTYMVMKLKEQLKNGHDLRAKQKDEFKKQSNEKDAQLHDLSNVTRSIIFEFDDLSNFLGREEVRWEVTPKNNVLELLQTLKGALCHAKACSDLEILDMIQTAVDKDRWVLFSRKTVKLLFEIFKNDMPPLLEPSEAQQYESMYHTIKYLLYKFTRDAEYDLIAACFEMYGKVIVSYERYLDTCNAGATYYTSRGLFNDVIQDFYYYNNPSFVHWKRITDLEEEIISSHFKDEEKTATLRLIHLRTEENIRMLKQRKIQKKVPWDNMINVPKQWADMMETLD